jgi:hypothetical protein
LGRVKKNLGVKPIVYTFPSFIREHLSGCSVLKDYRLWIAHLGVSKPDIPPPWSRYAIWQYSWSGRIAGLSGDVDLNVSTKARIQNMLVTKRGTRLLKPLRASVSSALLNLEAKPLAIERAAAPAIADEVPLESVPAPEGDLRPSVAPSEPPVTVKPQDKTLVISLLALVGILSVASIVTNLLVLRRCR